MSLPSESGKQSAFSRFRKLDIHGLAIESKTEDIGCRALNGKRVFRGSVKLNIANDGRILSLFDNTVSVSDATDPTCLKVENIRIEQPDELTLTMQTFLAIEGFVASNIAPTDVDAYLSELSLSLESYLANYLSDKR